VGTGREGINPLGYVSRIMELLFCKKCYSITVLWGHWGESWTSGHGVLGTVTLARVVSKE